MKKEKFNVKSSRFYMPCKNKIVQYKNELLKGQIVVELDSAIRYNGLVKLQINEGQFDSFAVIEEKYEDEFPARVKAAATALRDCKCYGYFEIEQKNNVVIIKQIELENV